jgi:predicted dehydrogenase
LNSQKIKIGILGSGGWGRTARKYLRNTGEFEIVACMDVNSETAVKAAEEERSVAYTDMQAFLNDKNIEAVSINTPVFLHSENSLAALAAGKHVFITKPISNRLSDAQKAVNMAEKSGLAYMVGHHARYYPDMIYAKELIQSGEIGQVCTGVVNCSSSLGLELKPGDWRAKDKENPGGPLLQCGIHSLDFLIGLFGPVSCVMAMMQDNVTSSQVMDNTATLLKFKSGPIITLISNYTTAYMHTGDFYGTAGNLHMVEHVSGLGQHEMYLQKRAKGDFEPWLQLVIPVANDYPDPHHGVLEKTFARQIRERKYDYTNARQAIDALKILEAAVLSHQTRQAVELN